MTYHKEENIEDFKVFLVCLQIVQLISFSRHELDIKVINKLVRDAVSI